MVKGGGGFFDEQLFSISVEVVFLDSSRVKYQSSVTIPPSTLIERNEHAHESNP